MAAGAPRQSWRPSSSGGRAPRPAGTSRRYLTESKTGVAEVIRNLIGEVELQLAIAGCVNVTELDRSLLVRID